MFTLRCTKRLLARLGSQPLVDEVEPTTRLGDWYANLLFPPGGQVVLAVNERSLLPVLIPAAPARTLVARFAPVVEEVLLRLGVPAAVAEAERSQMGKVRIGRTVNRQVGGSRNDFSFLMDAHLQRNTSLIDVAAKLAHTPCGPIGMKYPVDVVLELFLANGK